MAKVISNVFGRYYTRRLRAWMALLYCFVGLKVCCACVRGKAIGRVIKMTNKLLPPLCILLLCIKSCLGLVVVVRRGNWTFYLDLGVVTEPQRQGKTLKAEGVGFRSLNVSRGLALF